MLRDFSKIETFLTVVREKSFSKASKKLGISQPAVTQQIKLLEAYFDTKIIERKKNGIKLTKIGDELYKLSLKIDKCLSNIEKEMLKIVDKKIVFIIGSSYAIGNHILPQFLNEIKEAIKNDILVKVESSESIVEQVLDKKIDIGLIESPLFVEGLIYKDWMDDELVLFSKSPLPRYIRKEQLYDYLWICREEESNTRKIIAENFETLGIECSSFDVIGTVTSSTAVKHTILNSSIEDRPTVSIISKYVIEEELKRGELYYSRIKGVRLVRKLYISYLKSRKQDAFLDGVVNYISDKKRV